MASLDDLGTRVLRKLKVLGANETPSPEDLALANEKLRTAHYALEVERIVRWTLNDIPPQVENAYVLLGAYEAADDFTVPKEPTWFLQGMRQVQAWVHIPAQPDAVTWFGETCGPWRHDYGGPWC